MSRKDTSKRDAKICASYKEGYSMNQCAELYDISTAMVFKILKRNNVKSRPLGNPHNKKKIVDGKK